MYVFHDIESIRESLLRAGKILLLLDYDGTLVPIASRPELALMPPDLRHLLIELREEDRIILGIISGRALKEIKELVAIEGIIYVGNHGLEIESFPLPYSSSALRECLYRLRLVRTEMTRSLQAFPGSLLEDKGLVLAIHYRNLAPGLVDQLRELVETHLRPYQDWLVLVGGKKVWEIRPRIDCNKGTAVTAILETLSSHQRGLLPIYLGDDRTDEDAFEVLRERGITIYIGPAPHLSAARYYLPSQGEVKRFLEFLRDTLDR